jgi:hypothetical protein
MPTGSGTISYSKFDTKTDIVCHKRSHENSRMAYICLEDSCRVSKRIGCAHCFLEDHSTHKKFKIEGIFLDNR